MEQNALKQTSTYTDNSIYDKSGIAKVVNGQTKMVPGQLVIYTEEKIKLDFYFRPYININSRAKCEKQILKTFRRFFKRPLCDLRLQKTFKRQEHQGKGKE